ncbi:hypothetical protein ACFVHB_12420 [Kitasatospora sp. NPDC127111]|uniref:hypothetical protein n=1 Tax=Kitasatospora sp. NPDC127111 TaxID=3345363 RepID=UPI00362CCAEE
MTTSPAATAAEPLDPPTVIEHVGGNIQHGWYLDAFLAWLERRTQETGISPSLLTLQELQEGQPELVAGQLGLTYVPAPPNVRPGSRNALFFDPEVLRPDPEWTPYPEGIRHLPATARLYLIDPATGASSRRKVSVASVHGDFGDPHQREHQIRWLLANMVKDLRLGLIQGDWNSWPAGRAPLALDNVPDRAYALNRSILNADGTMRPDDVADRLLTYAHMTDVGHYAATVLGQTGADRATTEHGPNKDRQEVPAADLPPGGVGPIDRSYVSEELLPALLSAETPNTPEVAVISDHLPQITRWSREGLWAVMNRTVATVRH